MSKKEVKTDVIENQVDETEEINEIEPMMMALNEGIEEEEETNMSKRTIGTKLTKKGATTADDLVVGHLTSIGEIGLESEEIDVTTHDSVDDFKEFIAGSKDAGEVAITGYMFTPDTFEKMMVLANSREVVDWVVEYKSGHKWEFKAFLKSLKDAEKTVDGVIGFNGTLRISGKPTFTKASA